MDTDISFLSSSSVEPAFSPSSFSRRQKELLYRISSRFRISSHIPLYRTAFAACLFRDLIWLCTSLWISCTRRRLASVCSNLSPGNLYLSPVLRYPGRFFQHEPCLFRSLFNDRPYLSLSDNRIGPVSQSRIHEYFLDILEPARHIIQQIFAFPERYRRLVTEISSSWAKARGNEPFPLVKRRETSAIPTVYDFRRH